jgi:hypothetical protein
MLLATWNIADASTGKNSSTTSVHLGPYNKPVPLSFLNCTLSWDVRTAWIDSSNAIHWTTNTTAGACDRDDINVRLSSLDCVDSVLTCRNLGRPYN